MKWEKQNIHTYTHLLKNGNMIMEKAVNIAADDIYDMYYFPLSTIAHEQQHDLQELNSLCIYIWWSWYMEIYVGGFTFHHLQSYDWATWHT
jgi:hypothetical protein